MKITIEFEEKDMDSLLQCMHIGSSVAFMAEERERNQLVVFEQNMLKTLYDNGAVEDIVYVPENDRYYAPLELRKKASDAFQKAQDDFFWRELRRRLADRDFEEEGAKVPFEKSFEEEERMKRSANMIRFTKLYNEELERYGVNRLRVVE